MKRILLLSIWFIAAAAHCQNAFFDAKKIAEFHPPILNNKISISENDNIYEILRNYVGDVDSTSKLIGQAFKNNPFISVEIPAGGLGIAKGNLFSPLLGADVTNIADGLAKFLVDRTKQELSIAFFNQLKQDFDDKRYTVLQTLFPRTHHQLDLIGDKIYQFSSYLTDLRNAFIVDLQDLITTIPYVL